VTRFQSYIERNEFSIISEYITLMEYFQLDEMSPQTFINIKKAGEKLGLNVKKSKSLVDYLKGADKKIGELLRYSTMFLATDIGDNKTRKKIIGWMREALRSIDKRDVIGFLIQLDKVSFGLTSHIRHMFQSLFGVEVTTYNDWKSNYDYVENELRKIKEVLSKAGASEEEMKAVGNLENIIKSARK